MTSVCGNFCQIKAFQVTLASFNAPVAQLEECQFPKLEVTGSIPVGCAILSVSASRLPMFKKACISVAALAAVAIGLHWHSKAENPPLELSHTPQSLSKRPVNPQTISLPKLTPQTLQQWGFKVLTWQQDSDGLSISIQPKHAPAAAELYLQYMDLAPHACAEEVDFGDSRIETISATISVYRQQDPQSKVSPSVVVHNGQRACWLIEGNSGLDAKQDLASKLTLAKKLPL